jgi:hypothetical protein
MGIAMTHQARFPIARSTPHENSPAVLSETGGRDLLSPLPFGPTLIDLLSHLQPRYLDG